MAFDGPYSNELLALAADIPHIGVAADAEARARKRSMVCGSEVEVGLTLGDDGRIAAVGLDVQACALGQASASVFARDAIGASYDEVADATEALHAMLREGGAAPSGRFAALAALAPVRAYPRRHASTMLAFRAAQEAFAEALAARRRAAAAP